MLRDCDLNLLTVFDAVMTLGAVANVLENEWYNRGYHGSYHRNAKAVLNKYRDLPADKGKLKGQCLSYIGGAMSIYNIYWLELNENESHL